MILPTDCLQATAYTANSLPFSPVLKGLGLTVRQYHRLVLPYSIKQLTLLLSQHCKRSKAVLSILKTNQVYMYSKKLFIAILRHQNV